MIITHTQNADGTSRVYLGGKGSLECWISPQADRRSWTFHLEEAVTGNRLSLEERRNWAIYTLRQLAEALGVANDDLYAVPFEAIAALHTSDPSEGRRAAVPKRKSYEHCFMATAPDIKRPSGDFEPDRFNSNRRYR